MLARAARRFVDVVVVVRGPDAPLRLVRKVQAGPFWLNSRPVVFEGAPGFYMTASTRPLSDIANFGQLRRPVAGGVALGVMPGKRRLVGTFGQPQIACKPEDLPALVAFAVRGVRRR